MILHTGVDGGLHDIIAANVLTAVAWGCLAVNALVFYGRRAIRRLRGKD